MKVIRYNISNRSEECDCPTCGTPLYVGDHAYQIAPDGEAGYCSGSCASDAITRRIYSESDTCILHGYDDCPACTGETA